MVISILINTRFLLLADDIRDTVRLSSIPLSISKNQTHKNIFFYDDVGLSELGAYTVNSSMNKYSFAFAHRDLQYINDSDSLDSKLLALGNCTLILQGQFNHFLFLLWFVKDNCVSADFTYLKYSVKSYPSTNILSQNYINNYTSNCCHAEVEFSYSEICYIDQLFEILGKICFVNEEKVEDVSPFPIEDIHNPLHSFYNSQIDYYVYSRLERAIMFLQSARTQERLLSRISAYFSVLECLFSTEKTDITYKISQRIALYVGNDYEERIYLKKLISDAYNVRSRYVHGNAISKKDQKGEFSNNNLMRLSREIDNLLRIILTKIIINDHAIFNDDDKLVELF